METRVPAIHLGSSLPRLFLRRENILVLFFIFSHSRLYLYPGGRSLTIWLCRGLLRPEPPGITSLRLLSNTMPSRSRVNPLRGVERRSTIYRLIRMESLIYKNFTMP